MSTTLKQKYADVSEAAEIIGCTESRVRSLLKNGTLTGERIGKRTWAISRRSISVYKRRKITTGRPRKNLSKSA